MRGDNCETNKNKRISRKRPRRQAALWQQRVAALVLAVVLLWTSDKVVGISANKEVASVASLMVCRITVEGTMYARDNNDNNATDSMYYSVEQTVCIPIIDEVEDPETYAIQLPNHIETMYQRDIRRGKLHLLVMGARIEGHAIVTTPRSTFSVIQDYRGGRRGRHDDEDARHLQNDGSQNALGFKRYAIVRISTTDSTPTITLDQMKKRFTDVADGMEAQYRYCSQDQLFFYLTGTYDVKLPSTLHSFSANPRSLRESAMGQIVKQHNLANFPGDVADYVLFVIPPGTGSWVANAATSHFRSQYNDSWGISLSAVMHELGHNFGLGHSNQDGNAYSDISGYMGSVLPSDTRPKKCFNAAHHASLGWYETKTLLLSPLVQKGKRFKVAAFVDATNAKEDEHVILCLDSKYFMQFNRAKKFNEDTEEYGEMLVLTELWEGGTELLAALDTGDDYLIENYLGAGRDVRVKVCDYFVGNIFSADYLIVGVGEATDPCSYELVQAYQVTQSPSPIPTKLPTALPTQIPSVSSTTSIPTFPLSSSRSMLPSVWPSIAPSNIPSASPSNWPSLTPSLSPSDVGSPSDLPINEGSASNLPSMRPSDYPVVISGVPSVVPSEHPSILPSSVPSNPVLPKRGSTSGSADDRKRAPTQNWQTKPLFRPQGPE